MYLMGSMVDAELAVLALDRDENGLSDSRFDG